MKLNVKVSATIYVQMEIDSDYYADVDIQNDEQFIKAITADYEANVDPLWESGLIDPATIKVERIPDVG